MADIGRVTVKIVPELDEEAGQWLVDLIDSRIDEALFRIAAALVYGGTPGESAAPEGNNGEAAT